MLDDKERLKRLKEIYAKYPEIGDPEVQGLRIPLQGFGEGTNAYTHSEAVYSVEIAGNIPYIGFGENRKAIALSEEELERQNAYAAERIEDPLFQQSTAVIDWMLVSGYEDTYAPIRKAKREAFFRQLDLVRQIETTEALRASLAQYFLMLYAEMWIKLKRLCRTKS